MNCSSCGASLPPGAAFCTTCGSPAPYNASPAGSSPQFDPTQAAPPYGAPGSDQSPADPNIAASPPPPPTAYGAPPYGAPAYGAPPAPQTPYQANQYGGAWQPGGYGAPLPAQPPKKRSRLGLILAIVGVVLLLLCVGTVVAFYQIGKSAVSTVNATSTADASTSTTGNSSVAATTTAAVATITAATGSITQPAGQAGAPSGQAVDSTAASIITNPQTASAVNTNTAKPTKLAQNFAVGADIYVTVDINANGKSGYIQAKWYAGTTPVHSSKILNFTANDTNAYFGWSFDSPTVGTTEVYWCTQSDCGDAKLARVIHYTVSTAGASWSGQPPVAGMDINRPVTPRL
jgi:flagellar basal body-associated protein FliL